MSIETALGRQGASLLASRERGGPDQSGFVALSRGQDALAARIALIRGAEQSLDLQYYIWHDDLSGALLARELLHAAQRGVRVRLMLDDLDMADKYPALLTLDAHPQISVRLYNPFRHRSWRGLNLLLEPSRLNHRMHNKSLTVDGAFSVVGGRNVGDEYFDISGHSTFADMDVLMVGPAVAEVAAAFDRYWNSKWVVPFVAEEGRESLVGATTSAPPPLPESVAQHTYLASGAIGRLPFVWGRAEVLYDPPGLIDAKSELADSAVVSHMGRWVTQIGAELIIVSPYFVPGEALVEQLGDLVDNGVSVKVLTNSLATNDVTLVHAGYMRYREPLLQQGVELWEMKARSLPPQNKENQSAAGSSRASLHAKVIGVDRRYLFVGSFNMDPRSAYINTEMGVVFESEPLAQGLSDAFALSIAQRAYQVNISDGRLSWKEWREDGDVTYQSEPNTTLWQRLMASMLSWIVIEDLL
nr:phospholipase D family protein [Motiliproteus sediminis]